MANYKRSGGSHVGAKVFTGIVTFLLFAAIVLAGLSFGLGWVQLTPKEDPAQEQPDEETPEEENPLADLGGAVLGEAETNGIELMSAKLMASEYEDYGVSTLAETAYKITITPDPVDAIDTYSWTCTNTQQITLSPASDTKSCNVEITGAFATQATITITSNINADVTATVTVDYVKRITSVTISNTKLTFGGEDSAQSNTITVTPNYGTGTITPTFSVSGGKLEYEIAATTMLANTDKTQTPILGNRRSVSEFNYDFTGTSLSLTTPYNFFVKATTTEKYHLGVTEPGTGAIYPQAPTEVQLASAFNNSFITNCTGTSSDATLTINYTYSYTVGEDEVGGISESGTISKGVGLDVSALVTTASNIESDKGGIVA